MHHFCGAFKMFICALLSLKVCSHYEMLFYEKKERKNMKMCEDEIKYL